MTSLCRDDDDTVGHLRRVSLPGSTSARVFVLVLREEAENIARVFSKSDF